MKERLGRHIRSNLVGYVALFIALSGTAYAASGGNFILGEPNVAESRTSLSAPIADRALQLTNTDTAPGATALGLNTASGHPPLIVNSDTRVRNLNADEVDGLDSSQLEGARAYGWGGGGDCDLFGTKPNPLFCPIHSNHGIGYIVRVGTGTYCVGVNGIVPAHNVALVSVEWSGTKLPISGAYPPGNTAAMWRASNSACAASEFEVKTERQYPATASGSGGGSVPVSQPAVPSSDVAFVIAIP